MHVERELQELRERLTQVEKWKARREAIEKELAQVWVEGGEDLDPPAYVEEEQQSREKEMEPEKEPEMEPEVKPWMEKEMKLETEEPETEAAEQAVSE